MIFSKGQKIIEKYFAGQTKLLLRKPFLIFLIKKQYESTSIENFLKILPALGYI
jgi:hypothetical protein